MDSCRPHYSATWPALLHAATLWLTSDFFKHPPPEDNEKLTKKATEYFGLIFGNFFSVCIKKYAEFNFAQIRIFEFINNN